VGVAVERVVQSIGTRCLRFASWCGFAQAISFYVRDITEKCRALVRSPDVDRFGGREIESGS
jgi:hypothetical protein